MIGLCGATFLVEGICCCCCCWYNDGLLLLKWLASGAASVTVVWFGKEILNQKLRHLGVELDHAFAHRLFMQHETLHLQRHLLPGDVKTT